MNKIDNENILVLVVDDEADTRDGCERILSRMGYQVRTALSGDKGLEIVKSEPVSIVLLDLKMKGADGIEILGQIREFNASILVIVITGYATVELAIKAMKIGAYDFIPKPFEPDQLRIVVQRAHEKIRLTSEAIKLDLERQRTLVDLGNEKSRTRTIIESLPTGVVVTNDEGKVALMNPVFRQQMGIENDSEPEQPIEAYVQDESFCGFVKRISKGIRCETNQISTYEIELPSNRYFLARGRPIPGDGGRCIGAVTTLSDITALKALDMVKSNFVAEVSHELKSPLSTIHEQLALVIKDMTEGTTAEDLPILSRAFDKIRDLISLVGDLLDMSRIESGTSYSNPKPTHIDDLLERIVNFLNPQAQKKGQALSLKLPSKPVPEVYLDPLALESIFGNLITNAINYTQDNGQIEIQLSSKNNRVYIAIIDNGMGISSSHLKRIFDRFYRVKNEHTRYISGTGLGLPIVKGLLDMMGGAISVESKPGKGSTFTVVLPVG